MTSKFKDIWNYARKHGLHVNSAQSAYGADRWVYRNICEVTLEDDGNTYGIFKLPKGLVVHQTLNYDPVYTEGSEYVLDRLWDRLFDVDHYPKTPKHIVDDLREITDKLEFRKYIEKEVFGLYECGHLSPKMFKDVGGILYTAIHGECQ